MNNEIREKPIGARLYSPVGFSDSVNRAGNDERNACKVSEKFVVFFLDERLFAVAASNVAEISHPVPIAALPSAPVWLLGIGNLRGEIIAIVNLLAIIGENAQIDSAKTKLIVLKTENYDTAIAFPVDKLIEIVASDGDNIESGEKSFSPYICREFAYHSQIVRRIDTGKLLQSLAAGS